MLGAGLGGADLSDLIALVMLGFPMIGITWLTMDCWRTARDPQPAKGADPAR